MADQDRIRKNTEQVGKILRDLEDRLPQQGDQPYGIKSVHFAPKRAGAIGVAGGAGVADGFVALPDRIDEEPPIPDDPPQDEEIPISGFMGFYCDEYKFTQTADGGYIFECILYPRDAEGNVITAPAAPPAGTVGPQ